MTRLPTLCSILFLLWGCMPKVVTQLSPSSQSLAPLDYKEDVYLFGIKDTLPQTAKKLGIVKIMDSGFSTQCSWEIVIEEAKTQARKAGGNALKITKHLPPDLLSSCHRITADILKMENYIEPVKKFTIDSTLGYALLYVYRPKGLGSLIGYDLYLGNHIICRIKNKSKFELKIPLEGRHILWAKTEAKTAVPINFEKGKTYYLRCGVSMGITVGRPTLELVEETSGKVEYDLIESK